IRLALHHLRERLRVAFVEILLVLVHHGVHPIASRTSVAIIVARRSKRSLPSSRVASLGAPVYARSMPISRKLFLPSLMPFERLIATSGSARAAASSTRSGVAASTSAVSYRPAWHAPLLNSSDRVRAHLRVSGHAIEARPAGTPMSAALTAKSC